MNKKEIAVVTYVKDGELWAIAYFDEAKHDWVLKRIENFTKEDYLKLSE